MPARKNLLIVEDNADVVDSLRRPIENLGFHVEVAGTRAAALDTWRKLKPDVILLDILLPDGDGLSLLHQANSEDPQTQARVIVISTEDHRTADSFKLNVECFLEKPIDLTDLKAKLRAILNQMPPFPPRLEDCRYSLRIQNGQKLQIYSTGSYSYSTASDSPVELNLVPLNELARAAMQSDQWRTIARDTGQKLFQQVFAGHPKVLASYNKASRASDETFFRLCIEAPQEFLSAPFEFMFDDSSDSGGEFLALLHPISRSILGLLKKPGVSRDWLNLIARQQNELRVLVVASNFGPPLPCVDQEAAWLADNIPALFFNSRIPVKLVCLPSEKATLAGVTETLQSGTFDIFHFAGHGSHSELDPDNSGILLWSPSALGKQKAWLGVNQLHELLKKAKVRLAYLNCCRGSETASQEKLWTHSFLGVAHGVAMAGVPSVLGFRSQISDPVALKLCQEFYTALAEEAQPDVALYLARRQTKAAMPKDSGWLSPVLIDQS